MRTSYVPGQKTVLYLVDSKGTSSTSTQVGVHEEFVTTNDIVEEFKYLIQVFPQLSETKIKESIFNGPNMRKEICGPDFKKKLNKKELAGWKAFVKVAKGFLSKQ